MGHENGRIVRDTSLNLLGDILDSHYASPNRNYYERCLSLKNEMCYTTSRIGKGAMLGNFGYIGLFALVAIGMAVLIFVLPVLLRYLKVAPYKPTAVKNDTY